MFKTICRVVAAVLLIVAILWVGGMTLNSFKQDTELKNPLDVFNIHLPQISEPNGPDAVSADNDKNKTDNISNLENNTEVVDNNNDDNNSDITIGKSDNNEENKDEKNNTLEEVKQIIDKQQLENLISKIRISDDNKKDNYVRDNFEKPTKYFYINGTRYTRNKYAWHISKYLNSEEPFSYTDPYTGIEIIDMSVLDYEHIIPLSYLYKYSNVEWTNDEMNKYAYDMLIGCDVLNKANRSHGDKGPSEWLPEKNSGSFCLTWLTIAYEYDLALRKVDIDVCRLEILNALDGNEEVKLLNQFKEDTEEYKLQQAWIEDIQNIEILEN